MHSPLHHGMDPAAMSHQYAAMGALSHYHALMMQTMNNTPMRTPTHVHHSSMMHQTPTPMRTMGHKSAKPPTTPQTNSRQPLHQSPSNHHQPHHYAEKHYTPQPQQQERPGQRHRLADELRHATKEDLLQLLIDLTSYSADAASFIDCKAQLFQLRAGTNDAELYHSVEPYDATPVKQIGTLANHKEASPDTPYEKMQADQSQPPEQRAFCQDRHPCVFHYGVCRNLKSCLFAHAPCNLCMAFIRGDCPSGSKCTLVHRLPADASPQLKHLFQVKAARREDGVRA